MLHTLNLWRLRSPPPPPQPPSGRITGRHSLVPRTVADLASSAVRTQVLRVAHSEELEEAVVLDSDTTASSLEECRVGWDALDGGLGDFPLHMEPGLDPEDTDPGPSGAPPLSAPPPGRRPPGEVLGGNEGGGAPSPSSQRNCREECSMRERSPGGGSQELAIRFESPGGGTRTAPTSTSRA